MCSSSWSTYGTRMLLEDACWAWCWSVLLVHMVWWLVWQGCSIFTLYIFYTCFFFFFNFYDFETIINLRQKKIFHSNFNEFKNHQIHLINRFILLIIGLCKDFYLFILFNRLVRYEKSFLISFLLEMKLFVLWSIYRHPLMNLNIKYILIINQFFFTYDILRVLYFFLFKISNT